MPPKVPSEVMDFNSRAKRGLTGNLDRKRTMIEALKRNARQGNEDKFAIRDTEHWCDVCGNTEGTCAAYASDASNNGDASTSSSACPTATT